MSTDHHDLTGAGRRLVDRWRHRATAPIADTTVAPLSYTQQGIWLFEQLNPGTAVNNLAFCGRVRGRLDIPALGRALHRVVARHAILRTTVRDADPVQQIIHPDADVPLEVVDLGEDDVLDHARSVAATPFDLTRGPLVRVVVYPVSAVLLVVAHHLVADGWSLRVFFDDLAAGYTGTTDNAPTVRYADLAAQQRAEPIAQRDIDHWTSTLDGLEPLRLPVDRPRAGSATVPIELPGDVTAGIDRLAREAGATPFMVLLCALQILLARMCGQEDVTVGSPVAMRSRARYPGVIGPLVNMVALRVDFTGEPTVREALAAVRQACLAAYAHQGLPFETLLEAFAGNPPFTTVLVLQDDPGPPRLGDLSVEPILLAPVATQRDLELYLWTTGSRITGFLSYTTVEPDTAARIVDRFTLLLNEMTADPDQRIHQIPVIPSAELARIAELSAGTTTEIPDALIHELVERQTDRTPDATAVRYLDQTISYAELDTRANQLAHHLRDLGAGPDTLISICLPRTPHLITAIMAVLKAGAAYVPLDPDYPAERLNHILHDTHTPILITDAPLDGPWQTVLVDAGTDAPTHRPRRTASPDNLAYTIYTSGSTGRPKGVMIEHRHTVAMLAWAHQTFSIEVLANVLASTSICFDLSIYEIFAPLTIGGSLTLAPHNALDLLDKPAWAIGVTLINTVPSAAQELLAAQAITAPVINLAGEPLPPSLVDALHDHVTEVHNLYGPSEDTTYSTHAHTTPHDPRTPIGRPIHNTQVHLLDRHLQPVPIGSIGEIYLSGNGITRGYHEQPAHTAERYLPAAGGRLYRTGDLGRWRPDHQLDYHGRHDHQLKIHGHRIEPAEIETTLRTHPDIDNAIIVPHHDQLAAYLISPIPPNIEQVRAYLQARLPHYLVPTTYTHLTELPLTPNGKIDRAALPAPQPVATEHTPPRTPRNTWSRRSGSKSWTAPTSASTTTSSPSADTHSSPPASPHDSAPPTTHPSPSASCSTTPPSPTSPTTCPRPRNKHRPSPPNPAPTPDSPHPPANNDSGSSPNSTPTPTSPTT